MGEAPQSSRRWWTRVELNPDEHVEREFLAIGSGLLGTDVAGLLLLTNQRLIWTPPPSLISKWIAWQVTKEKVTNISVDQQAFGPFWRWWVLVEAGGRKRRFEAGGEKKAQEFLTALRDWAGLSS
jgi:hypothetical protein